MTFDENHGKSYEKIKLALHLPMQKSVAPTSIAILILPLYPARSIASLVRSKHSVILMNKNKKRLVDQYKLQKR